MIDPLSILFRLCAAFALGALIGLEREVRGKEAGFKTNSLVCMGAALFMIVSIQICSIYPSSTTVDPGRIAAQVVTGIGFLGGGAIIRFREGIKGLTTAAGIWVAAGIGLATGMGQYLAAIATTVLTLAIYIFFWRIDRAIRKKKKSA